MKYLRAILVGALLWTLIFVEWSIMVFVPVLKDMVQVQWFIHFLLLIPIVIYGVNYYFKSAHKINGYLLGAIMLATIVFLDAIISVPLFMAPKGMSHQEFFIQLPMIIAMAEIVVISGLYSKKR